MIAAFDVNYSSHSQMIACKHTTNVCGSEWLILKVATWTGLLLDCPMDLHSMAVHYFLENTPRKSFLLAFPQLSPASGPWENTLNVSSQFDSVLRMMVPAGAGLSLRLKVIS